MRRDIYQTLTEWKESNTRRPLLVRGARQTGKTYIIQEFGEKEFDNAEIDYLIEKNGKIIPVKVKSGSIGRMKSLHMFIETKHTGQALKISQDRFQRGNPIISLPFYAIESFFQGKEL